MRSGLSYQRNGRLVCVNGIEVFVDTEKRIRFIGHEFHNLELGRSRGEDLLELLKEIYPAYSSIDDELDSYFTEEELEDEWHEEESDNWDYSDDDNLPLTEEQKQDRKAVIDSITFNELIDTCQRMGIKVNIGAIREAEDPNEGEDDRWDFAPVSPEDMYPPFEGEIKGFHISEPSEDEIR